MNNTYILSLHRLFSYLLLAQSPIDSFLHVSGIFSYLFSGLVSQSTDMAKKAFTAASTSSVSLLAKWNIISGALLFPCTNSLHLTNGANAISIWLSERILYDMPNWEFPV